MKAKFLLSVFCFSVLTTSCNDDSLTVTSNASSLEMRAVKREISPTFDWENTSNIKLEGINAPVTLPWYTGASTNIPSDVLNSYKASEGWKLVYNFCSSSNYMEVGKYYLIFYNIFSGTLRTFYYNPYNITEATQTFWHFQASRPSKLFSAWSRSATPSDSICSLTDYFATNVTRDTVKSISRGWNYFDTDLSGYDPNLASQALTYSISAHCLKQGAISMESNAQLQTEGSIAQQMKGGSIIDNAIGLVGNVAKDYIESAINSSDKNGLNLNINPEKLMLQGAKHLVEKLFLKGNNPLNFSVKLNTTGYITSVGNIESNSQSNISPLSRLLISGSCPTTETTFLPSFDNVVGVWNLKTTPTIRYVSFQKIVPGEDLGFSEVVIEDGYGPIIDDGIIAPGREPEYKNRTKIINMKIAALAPITLDSIEVNPSLLPFIDHMEIETDVYDTNCPAIFRTGFRKSSNESAGITIEEMDTRSLLNDKRHALWNNCSVSQSTTKYWNYTSNPKA